MTVRKLVDYIVMDANNPESIKQYSANGYELVGGVSKDKSGRMIQAMAKYVDYHDDLKKKKRLGLF